MGGLVGWAKGTTLKYCANHGLVKLGDSNRYVGGLAGKIDDGLVDHCLNTGTVSASDRSGGIAGGADNTRITRTVNTGYMKYQGWSFDKYYELNTDHVMSGTIVGTLTGSNGVIDHCLNFGDFQKAGSYCSIIAHTGDGATIGEGNFYYCNYDGKHVDNESSYSADSHYRYADMISGAAAYNLTDDSGNKWLYQDIDNNTFTTHYPVPFSEAGTVYSNILCDGTQGYSNIYKSTGAHTQTPSNLYGTCAVCGNMTNATAATNVNIGTADELVAFARAVNGGVDFTNTTVTLTADIDFSGVDFPRIGTTTIPFKGTFDGQGHRIKNMTISTSSGVTGFFGCVAGANEADKTTTIKNLIIDSSCSVTRGQGSGTAGLIGCIQSTQGSICNVIIENCGNEATVMGDDNVSGILGGVYDNTNTNLVIRNCYNTGAIGGSTKSATICAIANCKHTITNCYNSGSLSGVKDYSYFCRSEKGSRSINNCYDVNATGIGIQKIVSDMLSTGELCADLNKNGTVFTQNVETDSYPVPGTAGLSGATITHIASASDLTALASSVNDGSYIAGSLVFLDNDIDLSGVTYTPIGTMDNPFSGTFNGLGHRIRNMKIETVDNFQGLFGIVSGTTTIKNVIIDSSCSISSPDGVGISALVGMIYSASDVVPRVTITNCGNEASVTGAYAVSGLAAYAYSASGSFVDDRFCTISNSYNTGAISGKQAVCSIGSVAYSVTNCYNIGSVSFKDRSGDLYSGLAGGNNFDINGVSSYTSLITREMVSSGELCNMLNNDSIVFTQNPATDAYPLPGTDGLTTKELHISDAAGLVSLSEGVANGTNYSDYIIYLDNDIDMTGSSFTRIGNTSHPFKGTFDGQGHRIKNWTGTFNEGGCHGLFGCVAGGKSTIKNVIIDASCSVTSNGKYSGTAGLIGCVQSEEYLSCSVIVENCGNEATITGYDNVAGIVGGVYEDTYANLIIRNSYNTGAIKGTTKSAALCAIANCHFYFQNCYNSGSVSGVKDKNYFYRTEETYANISNCYDVNGSQKGKYETVPGVTKTTASQVLTGELCCLLNKADTVFTQNMQSDTHPIPGTSGLTGVPGAIHITTPEELVAFATEVNSGKSYAGYFVYLDNDLDLSSVTFTGIGGDTETALFQGIFDGLGHRIKNWNYTFTGGGGHGFFRRISGTNCIIRNLVIDSSCSITAPTNEYYGTGGLIGFVTGTQGAVCNVTIENCGNEATVTGYGTVAGILGAVYNNTSTNLTITNCYNTGAIKASKDASAISASLNCTRTITNCYNSGTVSGVSDKHYFYDNSNGSGSVSRCYDVNGSQTGVYKITSDMVTSGELCNILDRDTVLFSQVIGTDTHPVFGSAGVTNYPTLHITSADELVTFANNVNGGNAYAGYKVYLDNDIDLSSVSNFPIIGRHQSTTFRGTFDGQGHRIKNMKVEYNEGGIGLFGCLGGVCTIRNLIIDSSCTINSTNLKDGYGTGGIAGKVQYTASDNIITFENCGNEATVKGYKNVAGILGVVITGTQTQLTIKNCYNTGAINGDNESATICGYAYNDFSIENCYNSGTLSGGVSGSYMFRHITDANMEDVKSCYDVNGSQGDCVTQVTADQLRLGYVMQQFNSNSGTYSPWEQNLGTDATPQLAVFDSSSTSKGLHYTRNMPSQWSSICLPYAVKSCDDYKFYVIDGFDDDIIKVSEVSTLSAGVPALVHRSSTVTGIDVTPTDSTLLTAPITDGYTTSGLTIRGTFQDVDVKSMNGYNFGQGYFGYLTDEENCKPFHAYLTSEILGIADKLVISSDSVEIYDANLLKSVSDAVNGGYDYSNKTLFLSDDMNLSGVDFSPIGTEDGNDFKGIFDGKGYRIKNMTISNSKEGSGLFGIVTGEATLIKNVIIDSSCSITSTKSDGCGVAGIVGRIGSDANSMCNIFIENCGNEATITGYRNVAGILGGVYGNDNSRISIINCYNTGAINGNSESAAICGYARKNYTITNCFNTGTLTGLEGTNHFYRPATTVGTTSVTNCFDVNPLTGSGQVQTGVEQVTADQMRLGYVGYKLYANHGTFASWKQQIESDAVPSLCFNSDTEKDGISYSRSEDNQWSSIVLPFDVTIDGSEPYTFYNLGRLDGNTMLLSRVDGTLKAGTPVILNMDEEAKNSTTGKYDLTLKATGDISTETTYPESVEGLTMYGVYESTDITGKLGYAVQDGSCMNILTLTGTVTCEPFHAWLMGGNPRSYDELFFSPLNVTITNATDLTRFATNVNQGDDFSKTVVYLANDIDMTGVTGYTPIGTETYPYHGTFDGQTHRIKNLKVNNGESFTGLFGAVGGYSKATTTTIKNVIIDKTCSFKAEGVTGVAGLVGCSKSQSGDNCKVYIKNCGNEADITGKENIAGILGGVYNNDNTTLEITNCYNLGNISGEKVSAALCGYARKNYTITNCYNGGTVEGYEGTDYFYHGKTGGKVSVTNCYDVNPTNLKGETQTGVAKIATYELASGELCSGLNRNGNVFNQVVGTDAYPVPGTDGLSGAKIIRISTVQELLDFANKVNTGTDYSGWIIDLDNDMDLTNTTYTPIGTDDNPFKGTFNGRGCRIKNLTLSTSGNAVGFFGNARGTTVIKNLIIDSSCSIISTNGTGVAGILGQIKEFPGTHYITIENCGNEATISGYKNVAGILGVVLDEQKYMADPTNVYTTVTNCYNTGSIKGSADCSTLCAYLWKNYTVKNCYNSGSLSGAGTTGKLFGYVTDKSQSAGKATVSNCFDVNGSQSGVGKIEKAQVTSGELCSMLNKDGIVYSQVVSTDTHPLLGGDGLSGIEEEHISTAAELRALATSVNAGTNYRIVILDNDIDLSGSNFTPIGTKSNPFRGSLDGQGYRIKNMTISDSQGALGLFGCVAGMNSVISNVTIDPTCSVTTTSGGGVAGLIGCVESASGAACNVTIQNCGNEATVKGTGNVSGLLGGVYGNDAATITIDNSYNTGYINGTNESAAICGYARKNYTITNCYNNGALTGGTSDQYFFRYKADGTAVVTNNYDVNGVQGTDGGVLSVTKEQIRSGYLCKILNSNSWTNTGSYIYSQELEGQTHPVPGTKGLYYERPLAYNWGTVCLPYALTSDENVQYMTLQSVDDNTMYFVEAESVAAGTPAVFKVLQGESLSSVAPDQSFTDASSATSTTAGNWTLNGTYVEKKFDRSGSIYYIANNKFWRADQIAEGNQLTVPAFRGWFQYAGSAAKAYNLALWDGSATTIGTIDADGNIHIADGKYVENGQVVIYKNGKKYSTNGQVIKLEE